MPIVCGQCGAVLAEGNAFCTKCGAPRASASESSTPRVFCTKCGAPLGETTFCTKCGALASTAPDIQGRSPSSGTASMETSTPALSSSAAAPAAPQPGVTSAAPIPKIIVIGGGIVALVVVLLVGGIWYAVHRARQKAHEIEAEYNVDKTVADLSAAANAASQNANKQTPEDVNKTLNELAAAANAATQSASQSTTPEAQAKSLADAASVANALMRNLGMQPSAIPADQLPSGTSTISMPTPNTYKWTNGGGTYTWDSEGVRVEYAGGVSIYSGCPVIKPAPPASASIVPVAATGNQAHDWALEYERTVGGPEADLVLRTGDINNLGFGWPQGFDPFSGQSTPPHPYPWTPRPSSPAGTDRIMVGSVVGQGDNSYDGYSHSATSCTCPSNWPPCEGRLETMPQAITLSMGALPDKINAVVFQIFVDDFQPQVFHSHFQVSLNGTRIPTFEYAINSLDQTGPIGKLVTLKLLPEYWPLLKSGTAKLLFDDPTTHIGDGYAIDFVRVLVNPHKLKYQVSLAATVLDADKHTPIAGATVTAALESAATDRLGKCELKGIPAGLVVATASAPGYDENSVTVDLPSGQAGQAEIQLRRHEETTAALEKSIAQTGTATVYGIHFDTGSAKLRPDSIPALEAVLGLINNRSGSSWIIAGHTDNQGSDELNIPLSKARATSVISWLTAHGIAGARLEPQGFGSSRPVADNATANGRFLNRRVEISPAAKQ